jgi:hypothetical protein
MDEILKKEFSMKGGVLIIGSLLWQDNLKENDNIRKKWREKYLREHEKIVVKAPIRYGRLSKNDVYTITFSNSCSRNKMGTCYFIPFKQTSITTFDTLKRESEEVSNAEGMEKQFLKTTEQGEVWSVLGILINPKTVEKKIARLIYNKWKKLIKENGGFNPKEFKIGHEKPCVDKRGKLNIDWPMALDKRYEDVINGFDFMIATATKPTKYPDITELAEKVRSDTKRYYFIENYKSGITTYQDIEVINRMPATDSSSMPTAKLTSTC